VESNACRDHTYQRDSKGQQRKLKETRCSKFFLLNIRVKVFVRVIFGFFWGGKVFNINNLLVETCHKAKGLSRNPCRNKERSLSFAYNERQRFSVLLARSQKSERSHTWIERVSRYSVKLFCLKRMILISTEHTLSNRQ